MNNSGNFQKMGAFLSKRDEHLGAEEPEIGEEMFEDIPIVEQTPEDVLHLDATLQMEGPEVLDARGIADAGEIIKFDTHFAIYQVFDMLYLSRLIKDRRPHRPPYSLDNEIFVNLVDNKVKVVCIGDSNQTEEASSTQDGYEAEDVCATQDNNEAKEVSATQGSSKFTEVCATQDDHQSPINIARLCYDEEYHLKSVRELCEYFEALAQSSFSTYSPAQANLNDRMDSEIHDVSDDVVPLATFAPINIARPSDDDEYRPQSVSSLRDYFEALSRSFDGNSSSFYYSPSTSMINETAHSANAETSTVVAQPQESNDASHEMAGPSGDVDEVEPEVEEDTPDVPKTGGSDR